MSGDRLGSRGPSSPPSGLDDTWWEDEVEPAQAHVPSVDFDPIEPDVLLGPDGAVALRVWRQIGFHQ